MSVLTTTSCSPGSSRVGFFIVLLDDSLRSGILAASIGVDKPESIVTGVGVVVSAFFRLTPDFICYK